MQTPKFLSLISFSILHVVKCGQEKQRKHNSSGNLKLSVSVKWVLPLHLDWLLRSQPVWSRKMNDHILHPDICFIYRTYVLCALGLFQVVRANFVRTSCLYNDDKSLKREIPSPFLQLSAIRQLSHLSIFWHFLLSALMWLN